MTVTLLIFLTLSMIFIPSEDIELSQKERITLAQAR